MHAVETIELTKDYQVGFWRKRPYRALDRLSLGVEPGEIFGLLGPNGAGKTTTLKILLRLVFPTSGGARLLGRDLSDISIHQRIGYLPENPYFYDHLTAEEFLNYVGELFSLSADVRRRRVGELLDRVGLRDFRGVPLRKFSKGMIQRVGIAQALINNPELVFLDEPMSGLDPIGRREVRDLILLLREQGTTVFFSTHILSDAETLCDRVAILDRGRLQGCGGLADILKAEIARTEIVLERPAQDVLEAARSFASSMVRTGERVRIEVGGNEEVEKIIARLLQLKARIVSLNPVRTSLEDYFLARVRTAGNESQRELASPVAETPNPKL